MSIPSSRDGPTFRSRSGGGAFKAETDDIREAPSLVLIDHLIERKARVSLYDPEAMDNLKSRYGDRIRFGKDPYEILPGAEALCLLTEWRIFRTPDWDRVKSLMARPIVIDGRNQYDPRELAGRGIDCYGIGRGRSREAR